VENPSEGFIIIITISSLIITFGAPVLIFYIFYLAKRRKLESVIKLVELGGEVKPEMLAMLESAKGPVSDMRRGLVWLAIGIPLTLALLLQVGASQAVFGTIPILIGVAYLVMMKYGHNESRSESHSV